MNTKKTRDLFILLFVGLFLYTQSWVFMFLIIGTLILVSPGKKSKTCQWNNQQQNSSQYYRDSKKFGLNIPREWRVKKLLSDVYRRYDQSSRLYPHLKGNYDGIIEDMWKGLAVCTDSDSWVVLLKSVLNNWSLEQESIHDNLKKKLKEVNELTHQWNEAKKEAYGEA